MADTSPAIEDYLKSVYSHTEWQDEPITPSALAAKLGIAPSSVTEMVKKLATAGLVTHVPYGAVRLTDAGTAAALNVVRRHRLIETWLVREMGYSWDEVHDEAEILEHSISDRLLEAIDERLGRPGRDPHGDPIPSVDGSMIRVASTLLADAPVGYTGTVLRISDRDPEVLRNLDDAGIGPGEMLRVTSLDNADAEAADAPARSITVSIDGAEPFTLPRVAAEAIWVSAE